MLAVIVCSILVGVVLTLVVQCFLIKKWFSRLPVLGPPYKPQYDKFTLPQELAEAIKESELKTKKESCTCLNLIFQFLFKELKDTSHVRRWVMRRMNAEFEEMLQTTTGRLLDKITVRDFNLGHTFPIVQSVSVQSVVTKDGSHDIDELALLVDLNYHGGFQLAVDVDLVFGKSAFLSVKVTNLKGTARLQFTRLPYTHWSFSFIEDPTMDFEVESQFEGRPISQLTSLIINQIRRSVRKKHTLPYYKIRYKPLFRKPESRPQTQDIYIHGNKLSTGTLTVTVMECSRLVKVAPDSLIFCTLAIDSHPWNQMMSSRRRLWVAHDIEVFRTSPTIGITFKEEFVHDKYEEMVLVDSVTPGSPAASADIRKNDVVLSVGSTKITSSKHAAKVIKQVPDRFVIRVERSTPLRGASGQEFRFEEDTVSLREADLVDPLASTARSEDELDDYVNITITPIEQDKSKPTPSSSSSSSTTAAGALTAEERAGPASSPKKGFSILSSSSGLFLRKRSNSSKANSGGGDVGLGSSPRASPDLRRPPRPEVAPSPRGSPELKAKVEHQKLNVDDTNISKKVGPGAPLQRRRSKSDVGLILRDKQLLTDRGDTGSSSSDAEQPNNFPANSGSTNTEEQEEDSIDLRKTGFVKATRDPVFSETFEFEVEDGHSYLNLCVWCKIPEKLDKQNRVVKPEKDVLIGHVSVQLMDVALDCMTTLQGDVQHTYQLTPAEVKAVASRGKADNLATHSGFDESLCYGDILLSYHHQTAPLTNTERRRVEKIRSENELNSQQGSGPPGATQRKPLEEGKHDFMGTHFQSATYCNFCHKKIWLKVAFQCRVCGMICHKKCMEKCQAQTTCSREGFLFKPAGAPPAGGSGSKAKDEKDSNKDGRDTNSVGSAGSGQGTAPGPPQPQKMSFLAKFRKDLPSPKPGPKLNGKSENSKPSSSMLDVPYMRRRRNSAPDRDDSSESTEELSGGRGLLSVSSMPRTRSSTSLQELLQDNKQPAMPADDQGKLDTDTSSVCSSDSDDELNLLKFFEQQKSSQNADEVVVTAAKEMGKELFAHLAPEERRDKLDSTDSDPESSKVNKLQCEIDKESVNRAELARMEREVTDPKQRDMIRSRIEKSDDKIQSLALLMLHYCAGLQHCLDQQEEERQRFLQAPAAPAGDAASSSPASGSPRAGGGPTRDPAPPRPPPPTNGGLSPVAVGQDAVQLMEPPGEQGDNRSNKPSSENPEKASGTAAGSGSAATATVPVVSVAPPASSSSRKTVRDPSNLSTPEQRNGTSLPAPNSQVGTGEPPKQNRT